MPAKRLLCKGLQIPVRRLHPACVSLPLLHKKTKSALTRRFATASPRGRGEAAAEWQLGGRMARTSRWPARTTRRPGRWGRECAQGAALIAPTLRGTVSGPSPRGRGGTEHRHPGGPLGHGRRSWIPAFAGMTRVSVAKRRSYSFGVPPSRENEANASETASPVRTYSELGVITLGRQRYLSPLQAGAWCERGDSISHTFRRVDLNLLRLPISPRSRRV